MKILFILLVTFAASGLHAYDYNEYMREWKRINAEIKATSAANEARWQNEDSVRAMNGIARELRQARIDNANMQRQFAQQQQIDAANERQRQADEKNPYKQFGMTLSPAAEKLYSDLAAGKNPKEVTAEYNAVTKRNFVYVGENDKAYLFRGPNQVSPEPILKSTVKAIAKIYAQKHHADEQEQQAVEEGRLRIEKLKAELELVKTQIAAAKAAGEKTADAAKPSVCTVAK